MRLLLAMILCAALSGCAELPIKDGELVINQSTTATMADAGVARVNNRF